jgi:4-hydroxybutyrate CoA-transferase
MNTLKMRTTITNWREEYARKLTTPDEAVKSIKSGDTVYIQSHAACPESVVDAMVRRADSLEDVKIAHIIVFSKAEYTKAEYAGTFRTQALFLGANMRKPVNEGRADYVPIFLHEIPGLMESGQLPIDVCFLTVSPPDSHGYCSHGITLDCTLGARKNARVIIAEVNKQMPRTFGRTAIHVSEIDHFIEVDSPLQELPIAVPTADDEQLGRYVADLVEDEATIQLGIGAIPNAVLKFLTDKKNLGVHSEMLSDGIVDLIEQGVVTNKAKTVLPGKTAVSFLAGSKRLYDFVDNNPSVEFHPSDYINDPFVVAANHKMTAINSALQIDVTGQVGSDSIGNYIYSGFGGQVDFVRGACRSKGGKAIIALPSTAKNGTISRITACLPAGSGVVTSRADVHYVATEYGVAQLYGKGLKDRAHALISIAHPQFRDQLLHEVRKFSWYC